MLQKNQTYELNVEITSVTARAANGLRSAMCTIMDGPYVGTRIKFDSFSKKLAKISKCDMIDIKGMFLDVTPSGLYYFAGVVIKTHIDSIMAQRLD